MTTITTRDTFGARVSQNFIIYNIYGYGGAGAKDASTFGLYVSSRDVLGAQGASSYNGFIATRDRAAVVSQANLTAYHRVALHDRARVRANSTLREAVIVTSRDRAAVFESSQDIVYRPSVARDRLGVRSAIAGEQSFGTITAHDTFGARARARLHDTISTHDTFGARGLGFPATPSSLVSRDQLGAVDRSQVWVDAYLLSRDRARVTAQSQIIVHPTLVVRDRLLVRGRGFIYRGLDDGVQAQDVLAVGDDLPLTDTDVWTADIRSWGMSRYVHFPVTDMVGTQYGVSSNGVYTTSGMSGISFVKTGVLMLSRWDQKMYPRKRINHVYTYANASAPLEVVVSADYRGDRLTQRYIQDYYRGGGATRASRCTVGKGFASNYLQLAIGGFPFDLDQVEVEISPTGRRI